MKTIILKVGILAICLMPIAYANAQGGIHLGVQGTPHMSWQVNRDDMDNTSFKYLPTFTGSFGITSQFDFSPTAGLGIDVIYSYQGQRYEYLGFERFKLVEYVKVPVMLVYNYEVAPKVVLIGKIGPQAGFLTNARLLDEDGDRIVSDQTFAYEDFELSGVLIGGVGFKLDDNLLLDAMVRLDYGFTDAENKDYGPNINNPVADNDPRRTADRDFTSNATSGITIGLRYVIR